MEYKKDYYICHGIKKGEAYNRGNMQKDRFRNDITIKNRQAFYHYEVLNKYIAGMVLKGTEIKSIREGLATLRDGHCYFDKRELFVKGINISPYAQALHYNHEATRERKLLLKKSEMKKLESTSKENGLTIIPLRMFINHRGYAKLEVALARGKKNYDKRESIKDKDLKRELSRLKYK